MKNLKTEPRPFPAAPLVTPVLHVDNKSLMPKSSSLRLEKPHACYYYVFFAISRRGNYYRIFLFGSKNHDACKYYLDMYVLVLVTL